MLRSRQVTICAVIAIIFWITATVYIRFLPSRITDPVHGSIGFVSTVVVSVFCVWLTARLAQLTPEQLASGILIVIADAMLLDGIALRWFHNLYSFDERTCRLASAWLLWGYGVSGWAAIILARRWMRTERAVGRPVAAE